MGICTLMLFSVNTNVLCINIWRQVTQGKPVMSSLKLTYLPWSWLQKREKVVRWLSSVNGSCPVASPFITDLLPCVLHVRDAIFEARKGSHYFLAQKLAVSCHNYSVNPVLLEPRLSWTLPASHFFPLLLGGLSGASASVSALNVSLACSDTFPS